MEIQLKNSGNISKKYRHSSWEGDNEQNLLEEALKLIQMLNDMRFVEKISRPIDKRLKEEYVEKFAGKMELLHYKLNRIEKQCTDRTVSQNGNYNNIPMKTRQSMHGSNTIKVTDWRKSIRTIESRYIEVFYEGSFKHYRRLMTLYNFSYKLETINIQEWANACLNTEVSKKTVFCCCC